MTRPSRTLWVDVTTLLAWKGRLTCIPRTNVCLLHEWLRDPALDARLCRFDAAEQRFYPVAVSSFEAWLESIRRAMPQETLSEAAPTVRLRERCRAYLKAKYQALLQKLRP